MIWPYHPKPKEDELFSSWLRRTAFGYEPKLHTFCNGIWPGVQIWNRDIDRECPEGLLLDLAEGTGTPLPIAKDTLLNRYEDLVFEHGRSGHPAWVLKLGVWHRKRKRYGQQFCPLCLMADAAPYYRTRWRLAWVTTCPTHRCRLADACDNCDRPCAPHRTEEPTCQDCGRDRRLQATRPADPGVLDLEAQLESAMRRGYFLPFGLTSVHPLAVFGVLRQLAKVVSSGQRSARLREIVADHRVDIRDILAEGSSEFDRGVEFEHLEVRALVVRQLTLSENKR